MSDAVVDVVIPVHTADRPIARATRSVLETTSTPTRVTIVCHDVAAEEVARAAGAWADDSRVRLLRFVDGIRSPAGPINAGLAAATAEFTSLLGSDDEYEPGAIDTWVSTARRHGAEVVIPPLRTSPGALTRSPPARPFRARHLDGVRDRLAYRTVQLGLVSRSRFGHIRMSEGLSTGEDVIQGASLWYSGARISLSRGPGYLIHDDDAADRTSTRPKPAAESLAFLDAVLDPAFTETLSATQRESFAIKLLRTHVMDTLGASLRNGLPESDLDALAQAVDRIVAFSPGAEGVVSRREARVLRGVRNRDRSQLAADHAALTDFRRLDNLVPAAMRHMLHREAPLRFLAAHAVMR